MLFRRTHTYWSTLPVEDLKRRLVGSHVKIHNLDFEVLEKEDHLTIIPHAEQEEAIKTLPITKVNFQNNQGKTHVVIKSNMRQFDLGGPQLIIIFCMILVIMAVVMHFVIKDQLLTYILAGAAASIFGIFWIRLETGYFDYVRKVRAFVKQNAA